MSRRNEQLGLISLIHRAGKSLLSHWMPLGLFATGLAPAAARAEYASTIAVNNYSFESPFFAGDNQLLFNGAYPGWTEIDKNTLIPTEGTNVGVINLPGGDMPTVTRQTTSGYMSLYVGDNVTRVDQTTNHVISASNQSITLGFDVGVDIGGPTYRGYNVTLYSEDIGGGNQAIIDTIDSTNDGNDPTSASSYVHQTLSLSQAQLSGHLGKKLGISIRTDALATSRDSIFDAVEITAVNAGVNFPVLNGGFDNQTGLVDQFNTAGLDGPNEYAFTSPYVGWTEADAVSGAPVVGSNVGPIWVAGSDVPTGATSSPLALYAGNDTVRTRQTTNHVISPSDASITFGVDVGNDLDISSGFGGYDITVFADDGLGTLTLLKNISSSSDGAGSDPADGDFLTKSITLTPAQYGGYIGQKIGISMGKQSAGRDPFFDTVTLSAATQGTQIPVINPGFDDVTGLQDQDLDPGDPSEMTNPNDYDFVNTYAGWKEYSGGVEVAGTNVGPIFVGGGDIAGGATSDNYGLYQGNVAVTIEQTTTHAISANDTSVRLAVDVGNDSEGGFGGYLIALYADDGLGNTALIKSMSTSGDQFAPLDNTFLTLALDLSQAELQPFLGKYLRISLGGQGGPRDLFYDSVNLTFTATPEPASGLLFAFGGLAAIHGVRRRRVVA